MEITLADDSKKTAANNQFRKLRQAEDGKRAACSNCTLWRHRRQNEYRASEILARLKVGQYVPKLLLQLLAQQAVPFSLQRP